MHFSFVSIPATGHVNPTLAVVSELVRRGHRVTYFTAARFAPRIEEAGAAFRASGEDWMAWLPVPGAGQPARGPQLLPMMQRVFEDLRESFPALVGHLREDPPDAVCFDAMTVGGSMAAEKTGIPAIALMPTYATNEHFSFRALLPGAPPPEMKEVWTTAARLLAEFAAGQGVKMPRIFDGPPAPFNIVFIPREFQPMGETFDERFRFVGPCVGQRGSDPTWTHEGPRPLLFISLGTTPLNRRPDFFRLCLDAFGHSQWDVAMAIGEQTDRSSLGPIPANVQIRPFFPQLQVLRQADVFLTHAGMNSAMEALNFEVPLVAVPQQPEQEATARRLEELGLGRRLAAGDVTAPNLLRAVSEVSADGGMRRRVAAMGVTVRSAGGAAAAATAIEARLEGRHGGHGTTTVD